MQGAGGEQGGGAVVRASDLHCWVVTFKHWGNSAPRTRSPKLLVISVPSPLLGF